jgi:hypothetical protein
MNRYRTHSLLFLLCLLLLCSAAQATVGLQITVRDSIDNTSIPNAVVYVNGQDVARTNNNGQYFLSHNGLSDQRIRISVTGYDDWENIIAKNNEILLVNLSRKTVTLKINLYDSDTLGPVAGAQVNISALNSTQSKLSDSAGAVAFIVNASMLYSVDITAPNYEPRSGMASVGMENKAVQFWLLSGTKYSFVVKDKESKGPVQGAEIRLNSILAGKTDERGILSTPVARNKDYTVEIRKDGYEPITESRTISQADALYTAEITKAPIGAFVFVYDENNSPINGADIYINGNLSGTTNQNGRHTFPDLVFGSYPVEVKKTGYIASNRSIIVSNKSEDYTFTLSFEGSDLTIFVKDKGATEIPNASIAINGAISGQTDNHGQFVTKVKFNQIYNITASRDGYLSSSVEKQVVQGNATDSVTISLEKTMDWGFLEIIVIVVIVVLVLFAAFRKFGKKPGHHVMRRNEI